MLDDHSHKCIKEKKKEEGDKGLKPIHGVDGGVIWQYFLSFLSSPTHTILVFEFDLVSH